MEATRPLLTIAIPTWNRSSYLALTLDQLALQFDQVPPGAVEILISDNCSPDATEQAVAERTSPAFPLRYLRNAENIGSDANIAQCFNLARGEYVLLLGDDDILLDGVLAQLCAFVQHATYGVICMRPYGYERNFQGEYPGTGGKLRDFGDAGDFLAAIGPYMTLISCCLINKRLLEGVDARSFCGGNLVQVHLVMRAALRAPQNRFCDQYKIACKRNNSGGYDFSQVFVEEFFKVLDSGKVLGLTEAAIRKVGRRMLISYYPTYLFRQRISGSGNLAETTARFDQEFSHDAVYRLWVSPILWLPKQFAVVWGLIAIFVGRTLSGDIRRGLFFAWRRIRPARSVSKI